MGVKGGTFRGALYLAIIGGCLLLSGCQRKTTSDTSSSTPIIHTILPAVGPPSGGQTVLISGEGFLANSVVTFNGVKCADLTAVSATLLSCVTPAHAESIVDVTVTNTGSNGVLLTATKTNGYTFRSPPVVSNISPNNGPYSGGTVVTITGTGFLAGATVSLGGVTCSSPQVASSTQMTCATGSRLQKSAVDVVVTNSDGQSGTLTGGFTYRDLNFGIFVDGNSANGLNVDVNKAANSVSLVEFNGKLYAAWREMNATASQVRVALYNGDDTLPSWTMKDGGGLNGLNHDSTQTALLPRFIVFNSKLYLCWGEDSPTDPFQIRVAVYNGNDLAPAWNFVDGNGVNGINKNTSRNAGRCSFAVLNSKLYISWRESNGTADQVRVAVYNGNDSSPSWTFVDGNGSTGLNKDTTKGAEDPRAFTFNSKLYLIWQEFNESGVGQIRVRVYNGNDSAQSWTFVDGGGTNGINKSAAQNAARPMLTSHNSKLYAFWQEANSSGTLQIRAAVYNGNDGSPAWTFVDGSGVNGINKNTSRNASYVHAVALNSSLYLAWVEGNGTADNVRVVTYNNNDSSPNWTFIDGNGASGINKDTSMAAKEPFFSPLGVKLYVGWIEMNGTADQVRVSWGGL